MRKFFILLITVLSVSLCIFMCSCGSTSAKQSGYLPDKITCQSNGIQTSVISFSYDEKGNLTGIERASYDNDGLSFTSYYTITLDSKGLPQSCIRDEVEKNGAKYNAGSKNYSVTTDDKNRMTSLSYDANNKTDYTYRSDGTLESIAFISDSGTAFSDEEKFDKDGWETGTGPAGSTYASYEYAKDSAGKISSYTISTKTSTSTARNLELDDKGNVSSIEAGGAEKVQITYKKFDNLSPTAWAFSQIKLIDPSGLVPWSYISYISDAF